MPSSFLSCLFKSFLLGRVGMGKCWVKERERTWVGGNQTSPWMPWPASMRWSTDRGGLSPSCLNVSWRYSSRHPLISVREVSCNKLFLRLCGDLFYSASINWGFDWVVIKLKVLHYIDLWCYITVIKCSSHTWLCVIWILFVPQY